MIAIFVPFSALAALFGLALVYNLMTSTHIVDKDYNADMITGVIVGAVGAVLFFAALGSRTHTS